MGMTISEKIIADHAGRKAVASGEIVIADADIAMSNEMGAAAALRALENLHLPRAFNDPLKAVVVADHFTPARDIDTAEKVKYLREGAAKYGYRFFEMGDGGIEHIILPDKGIVRPGQLVMGCDSHTCTYGALGAFSVGTGTTDLAAAWSTGKIWLKVPETIRVDFNGRRAPWIFGKDLILALIGQIGVDGALYKVLEYHGEAVSELTMADRFTIANMSVEAGAKTGIFQIDGVTEAYLASVSPEPYKVYQSDADSNYVRRIEIRVDRLEPQIALPGSLSHVCGISEVEHTKIDQVIIGSCSNGRLEDLRIAADILRGKRIAAKTRCIVIPGSQQIYQNALREGTLTALADAGCVIAAPTCGPCVGGYMGILAAGETCLATTTRNFVGRMGHVKSEVYLGSPACAAAAALCGEIRHPGKL